MFRSTLSFPRGWRTALILGVACLVSPLCAQTPPVAPAAPPPPPRDFSPTPTVIVPPIPGMPAPAPVVEEKLITKPSGLKYVDLVEGTGPMPLKGQKVTVNYVGKLPDGKVFDSSFKRGKPYTYLHRVSQQVLGWIEGVDTMKVGGKRKLIVPPRLGYGTAGQEPIIPPDATLIFEIELISVEGPPMN